MMIGWVASGLPGGRLDQFPLAEREIEAGKGSRAGGRVWHV